MGDIKIDGVIYGGDLLDLNELSTFSEDKPEVQSKKLKESYRLGNEFLDIQQKIVRKRNKGARFIYIEGNHEGRVVRYLDRNPKLRGFIELEDNLKLKERGIRYVRCYSNGEIFKKGNAVFIHGKFTNIHHAKKHVERYGTNIFYSHTHDCQSYSWVMRGANKTLEGASLGCLCNYDQSYLMGNPTNWMQGFGVFHFFPDDYFSRYMVRVFRNRFHINGKTYEGN